MAKTQKVTKAPVVPTGRVLEVIAPAPAAVAIAPAMGPQGKSTKGGHHMAACTKVSKAALRAKLAPTATLLLTNATVCPWRPGSDGFYFFSNVLVPLLGNAKASTVGDVIAKAKASNHAWRYPPIDHLIWLYTWGGSHLQVNGQLYAPAK